LFIFDITEERYFPVPGHEHVQLFEENLKSLPKQLKPSIVHRDPHDLYNHHDKVRTQDKDAGPSFYEEPHNPVHHVIFLTIRNL
jgi:hypothetical protein